MADELNIFYADDDPDDLEFFRDVTATINKPIRVFTHECGENLIEALKKYPPSAEIIFLDLNMPGKDGYDILQEIRNSDQLKNVPVVIFSTTNDTFSVAKSMKMGASFYVKKSNSFEGLKRSIEDTIAINWSTFRPSRKNFVYSTQASRQ